MENNHPAHTADKLRANKKIRLAVIIILLVIVVYLYFTA